MLRKRVTVLVAAAVMVLSMLAVSAPVFAQGVGGCDPNPGGSEAARSRYTIPPESKPGAFERNSTANEQNPRTTTGVYEQNLSECA